MGYVIAIKLCLNPKYIIHKKVSDTFCYLFSNLDADGFQPGKVEPTDKWEGEDEEDDIKDAWDKSDSEDDISKDSNSEENKITKTKPKKKLADKIAEREALKEKERAARAPLTEEERLAEKLRLQKLEENANIQLARDMCGKSRYVMLLSNVKICHKGMEFKPLKRILFLIAKVSRKTKSTA